MIKYIVVLIFSVTLFNSCTSAPIKTSDSKLAYSYNQLKLRDIDDMVEIVEDKMAEYKQTNNSEKLYEVMTIALSRPNNDNILERIMLSIRYSLDSNDLWEDAVEAVVDNGITALKNETTAPSDQVSYIFALQNLLVEFKPEFQKLDLSPKFERNIIEKIAEANLVVSDEANSESGLNLMSRMRSPSDIAEKMLAEIDAMPAKKNK